VIGARSTIKQRNDETLTLGVEEGVSDRRGWFRSKQVSQSKKPSRVKSCDRAAVGSPSKKEVADENNSFVT
jgi:hypothetical protein